MCPEPTAAPKDEPDEMGKISGGSPLLTGAIGLIGVLLGGFIQYYIGGSLETEKQRMQLQLSAYSDFAKAQAALQRAELKESESEKKAATEDANLKIRDAAFRIVIFSPAEVVRAFAAFVEEKHKEECDISAADMAVYRSIRRLTSSDDVSNRDIAMSLFACKMKEPPGRG
jgi:hypothetical protein